VEKGFTVVDREAPIGTGSRGKTLFTEPCPRRMRMPQQAWSKKRERQYEHIKDSQESRGVGEERAEEIAARTVNKNRAQSGEAKTASKTSTDDISPQRRGGLRSGRPGPRGRTKPQLYAEAQRKNIKGRSTMTRQQLLDALGD
jgi:hypothetical protein